MKRAMSFAITRLLKTALAVVIIVFLFALSGVFAHSFYPWECCSDQDCYPIPVAEVRATPGGWLIVSEGLTIPFSAARPSPDGRFHICRHGSGKGKTIVLPGKPPCFWAPEGAS